MMIKLAVGWIIMDLLYLIGTPSICIIGFVILWTGYMIAEQIRLFYKRKYCKVCKHSINE